MGMPHLHLTPVTRSVSDHGMRPSTAGAALSKPPGEKMTGRYYQVATQDPAAAAAAATAAAAAAAEAKAAEPADKDVLAELEQHVAAAPKDEERWLLFALQHIDFGAMESLQGMPCASPPPFPLPRPARVVLPDPFFPGLSPPRHDARMCQSWPVCLTRQAVMRGGVSLFVLSV